MSKFEMNDKCAAGTGRFLEIMANVLGYSLDEFSRSALSAKGAAKINSMCTVFAESEVISLITQGASRHEVALGIHQAIVSRSIALLKTNINAPGGIFCGRCGAKQVRGGAYQPGAWRPCFCAAGPANRGAFGAAIHAAKRAGEPFNT